MAIFFNKDADYSKIEFGNPIKGSDGKYFVTAFVKDEDVSNEIMCQFGTRLQAKHSMNSDSTSLECIFADPQLKEFVSECDDHMLAFCKDNKEAWFNNTEISDSYLDNAMFPSFKAVKKSESCLMKLRTSNSMNIFDSSKEEISIDSIVEDSKISIIVHFAGLWFTKTRFGLTWKIKQIKLHNEKPKSAGQYLFEDVEDEELDNVFPDE
tara:strand:+ start:7857 stop:8483 length:627 start_codon:yes stop_codon:yes gene_type:complete